MYERILSLISIEWENVKINERISLCFQKNFISTLFTFLRHSTSVECLSAIALRSSSALANQNVSMDLISQSRYDLSLNQFTPSICMCLYTSRKINTRSQNSFWDWSKIRCFLWGESSEKYQCPISVSISTRDSLQMVVCRQVHDQSAQCVLISD